MLQMHPAWCACGKSFNMKNIQDFVIGAQLLWLACSISSTSLYFGSPHTFAYMFCTNSLPVSLFIQALCRNRSRVTTLQLQTRREKLWSQNLPPAEIWGLVHNKWKIMDNPHEPGSLNVWKIFSFRNHIHSEISWLKLFKNHLKTLKGPEHVSELSPQFFRDLFFFFVISLCWTWQSNPVPIKAHASLHWFNRSVNALRIERLILLASSKILSKRLWQVPATLVFFRHSLFWSWYRGFKGGWCWHLLWLFPKTVNL